LLDLSGGGWATWSPQGYATSWEESEEGVDSITVAFLFERSAPRLALNMAVPLGRLNRADVERIGELMRSTVDRTSRLLH
jgi:DNA-binding IclR family transcriptional regulator